ncbi:MAG: DNA repair exonuclease, partial [Anaeroplasmataceae bacterium]|nr:DNA repair exonuclease [Anaeroplasmataceae bacterium]
MKILHCADIHLGSKINHTLKQISKERKSAIRLTFYNMIKYAKENSIPVIILAGDVFDCDAPTIKDKEYFYNAIKSNPGIDFLYLRGNHDSLESYQEQLPNLKTFNEEWTSYEYEDIVITGIEITKSNATAIYSTLKLSADKKNIVVLHGQIGDSSGVDKINLTKLRGKNIDYLALGHIHSYQTDKLDDRGIYVYSGCLEGRGFDELGEKGFVVINSNSQKLEHQFIPFSSKEILEIPFDLTGVKSAYDISKRIEQNFHENKENIIRIILTGEIPFELENATEDIISQL